MRSKRISQLLDRRCLIDELEFGGGQGGKEGDILDLAIRDDGLEGGNIGKTIHFLPPNTANLFVVSEDRPSSAHQRGRLKLSEQSCILLFNLIK